MSYILEALKKAQAERQLGSAPTIHAPVAHSAPESADRRKPLVIGAAAGVLLLAGAVLAWRLHAAAPAPAQATVAAASNPAAAAPAPAAPVPAAPAPASPAIAAVPEKAVARASSGPVVALVGAPDAPEPVAAKPAKPAVSEPAHKTAEPVAAPVAERSAAAPAAPAAVPVPPASADDTLPTLNGLPEAVRRDVPKVGFGGYMYSPNPADRLVLVDKVLRHEGEEVAPGLILEKLLPKGAVLNYRGYRYRVPF